MPQNFTNVLRNIICIYHSILAQIVHLLSLSFLFPPVVLDGCLFYYRAAGARWADPPPYGGKPWTDLACLWRRVLLSGLHTSVGPTLKHLLCLNLSSIIESIIGGVEWNFLTATPHRYRFRSLYFRLLFANPTFFPSCFHSTFAPNTAKVFAKFPHWAKFRAPA